jgi:hypothetical protein
MEPESVTLPPFNPEPQETASVRWECWLKRFQNFLVAKGIDNAAQQHAMLLHYGGEEVFEIAEALAPVDAGGTYDKLQEELNSHLVPRHNVEYQVFLFRQEE